MSPSSSLVGGLACGVGVRGSRGTLHGLLGLLDGALVGWKLSNVVVGARSLANARAAVFDRLDEIAATCSATWTGR